MNLKASRVVEGLLLILALLLTIVPSGAAERLKRYFGHDAIEDRFGVIAPWYKGQNGQFDLRVRIAAETMKRFPWATTERAVAAAPEYLFSMIWEISADGTIHVPTAEELWPGKNRSMDWTNGDRVQMAATVLNALIRYYRYTGDPAALAHISLAADAILDHCQTAADHPWPRIPISVPVNGKYYGKCDPDGWIQLDHVAEFANPLLSAYQITGNQRWLEACKHWGDLLVQNRNRKPGAEPWSRYANPDTVFDGRPNYGGSPSTANRLTGGIAQILMFLDGLIRVGYTGAGNGMVEARDAGRRYLRDNLLPRWIENDAWGRSYWDWEHADQGQNVTVWVCQYLMAHPEYFKNWKNDVRNILSLYLNHASVSEASRGEVYSGAWALPEGSACCGASLSWAGVDVSGAFAEYGVRTGSEWAREIARRMLIIGTYDAHDNGKAEDKLDGGVQSAGSWFKGTHPGVMFWSLDTMAWLPEILGPARENHVMQSSATVSSVKYAKGNVSYSTFDAPKDTVDVLRLAFEPRSVTLSGVPLPRRSDLNGNGFIVRPLPCGDFIATIRHDGARRVFVEGNDPQSVAEDPQLKYEGAWSTLRQQPASGGEVRASVEKGASASFSFMGNQVRILASVGPEGGLADVYLDGRKQLAGIDFWNPGMLYQQVVYYQNGLPNGQHSLKIVAQGEGNPVSRGHRIDVDTVQYSEAVGEDDFGAGGGPKDTQRMVFGYTERSDYVDTKGNAWKPGTELVVRTGHATDAVARTWWMMRQAKSIANTPDPELYNYGVHWPEIVVNVTVGPGTYHVRLKFAETQYSSAGERGMAIFINGEKVTEGFDIFATAGGSNKAADLVYNNVQPKNGIIGIRLRGSVSQGCQREAIVQAIEVGPGDGGTGATPKKQ